MGRKVRLLWIGGPTKLHKCWNEADTGLMSIWKSSAKEEQLEHRARVSSLAQVHRDTSQAEVTTARLDGGGLRRIPQPGRRAR